MKVGSVQCISTLDWQRLPSSSQGFTSNNSSKSQIQTGESQVKTNKSQVQVLVFNIVFQVIVGVLFCTATCTFPSCAKSLAAEIKSIYVLKMKI